MDDNNYQRIVELIGDHQSIANFAPYGNGVTREWVERAEAAIGAPLPDSYKWWLMNYGGGEVGGEEIYSIYGQNFDEVIGGDIVYMYRLAIKSGENPKLVPLCHSDVDGVFAFEIEDGLQGNEYHIFSRATRRWYAENFLDFLEKRIVAFT